MSSENKSVFTNPLTRNATFPVGRRELRFQVFLWLIIINILLPNSPNNHFLSLLTAIIPEYHGNFYG